MKKRKVFVKTLICVDNPLFNKDWRDIEYSKRMVDHPFITDRQTWVSTKTIKKPYEFEGIFHEWGLDTEEEDTGFASYTVAIVEDNNGHVYSVAVSDLKFLSQDTL